MAAFENMKVNLLANRLVPEKVPLVLQYNKQDLPDLLPRRELDAALNPWKRPTFPAVAAPGEGVLETFLAVVQEMLAGHRPEVQPEGQGARPGRGARARGGGLRRRPAARMPPPLAAPARPRGPPRA